MSFLYLFANFEIIPIFRGMKSDFCTLVKLWKCDLMEPMSTKKENTAPSAGFKQLLREEFRMACRSTGAKAAV